MKFRKSVETDINDIMKIINQAQDYFKEQGIDQWQNNYPNTDTIKSDVLKESSYVLLKDNSIVATTAIFFDKEKTYEKIYDGEWISDNDYATIHRIAVDNNHKGIGISSQIIKAVEDLCLENNIQSIKVDTHEDNLSMQSLLKKNKFKLCGIIYVEDGSKRVAFEKVLR